LSNDERRRLDHDKALLSTTDEGAFDCRWCADEVAIDFPAIPAAVDRIRAAFVDDEVRQPLQAEIRLSPSEAFDGVTVPLDVPVFSACSLCGGRGESWMEWCRACGGTGESLLHHRVRLTVPARVLDGARFRFRVTSPLSLPTRIEVRVAVELRTT
jgi:hypothetical protein